MNPRGHHHVVIGRGGRAHHVRQRHELLSDRFIFTKLTATRHHDDVWIEPQDALLKGVLKAACDAEDDGQRHDAK